MDVCFLLSNFNDRRAEVNIHIVFANQTELVGMLYIACTVRET